MLKPETNKNQLLEVSTKNNTEAQRTVVIYYRLSNTAVGMMMETNLENSKYTPLRNHLLGFIYHPFVRE